MALRLKSADKVPSGVSLGYVLTHGNSGPHETYLELPLTLTLVHGEQVEIGMSLNPKAATPEEAFARLENWLRRAADAVKEGRTNLTSIPL